MSEQTAEATTPESPNGATQEPVTLPDDHPLVKALAAQKEQIKTLKERAHRLDEIEDAQKSAEERAAERLAAAEERATQAEARALRRDVALEFQLSKDDAALLDKITDEDAMRALAGRLAQGEADRKKSGNHVPREGNKPRPAGPASGWTSVLNEFDRQRQT